MGKLADKISAAQSRVSEAESKGDESAKATAEAELSTLRSLDSEGYGYSQSDVNTAASTARQEGDTSGRTKAEKDVLKRLGISEDEDSEAALKAIADWRANQKTEADQLKTQVNTITGERDTEKTAREKAEARLREREIQDAITVALEEAGYKGKTVHALNAVDRNKVEEKEENGVAIFDAKPAIEQLKTDEFPGFEQEPPDNPDTPPQSNRSPQGQTAGEKFEKRVGRRGRIAG